MQKSARVVPEGRGAEITGGMAEPVTDRVLCDIGNALTTSTILFEPDWLEMGTPAWIEHIPFALWLIEAHRPGYLVELGTHFGNSYFSFCQGVARIGLPTRCYAIDTWRGDEQSGYYDDHVFEAVSAHNEAKYGGLSRLLRCKFDEALSSFLDGTIDLLHIDGLHTYEAVKHDFESWLPKLSERAVVLLHDTNVREGGFGVFRLWAELAERYPNFEFLHGHGLGVLGVGPMVGGPVKDLFAAGGHGATCAAIRGLFWRSAAALRSRQSLHANREEVARLALVLGERDKALEVSREEATRLANVTIARQGDIDRLGSLLSERDTDLQASREEIARLTGALAKQEAKAARAAAAMVEAQGRVEQLATRATTSEAERSALEASQQQSAAALATKEEKLAELERASIEGQRKTKELSATLADREMEAVRLRAALGRALGRPRSMSALGLVLLPLNHLEFVNCSGSTTEWRMTGGDSSFLLDFGSTSPLAPGHYRLIVEFPDGCQALKLPLLYVDSGKGFSESECLDLHFIARGRNRYVASLTLANGAHALRFDPSVEPGRLVLANLLLRRVPRTIHYGLVAATFAMRRMKDPKGLTKGVRRAVRVLFREGPRALAAELRHATRQLQSRYPSRAYGGDPGTDRRTENFPPAYASEYQPQERFFGLRTDIKAIAFHLPQFHPCKQNEEWWGADFTEWTNTRRARPRFDGHYQPRVPHRDIGYYDLSLVSALRKQAELARAHGLYGFCFYYYWFSGKRILEKPVDLLLENPAIGLNFCLCWANENWTRTWDGLNQNILLEQNYLPEDPAKFIEDIHPYLKDPRYICVDGKPVIIVYKPQLVPSVGRVFDLWRQYWKNKTGGELLIWCVRTDYEDTDLKKLSAHARVDAVVEFPPHVVAYEIDQRNLGFDTSGHFFDYQHLVSDIKRGTELTKAPDLDYYRTVMLGWDNSARRENGWSVWHGFSLNVYYGWLRHIIAYTRKTFPPDRRFMFINAWNEWAEGTYLEPDAQCGYASINTTSRALFDLPMRSPPRVLGGASSKTLNVGTIAVHVHLYYEDLADEFIGYLANIPCTYDLFITTDTQRKSATLKDRFGSLGNVNKLVVLTAPNKGRDVAPLLVSVGAELLKYDIIGHFHTKKSRTVDWGNRWRWYILDNLLGSEDTICAIFGEFHQNPELGLVYPPPYTLIAPYADWGGLEWRCQEVLRRIGCDVRLPETPSFPVGSMFWGRSLALKPILRHAWSFDDFEEEEGQIALTMGHCVERIWRYVAAHSGYHSSEFLSRRPKTRAKAPEARRLVLFAHYDVNNIVSDPDLYLTRELATVCSDLVFVTNSVLSVDEMKKLRPFCSQLLARNNTGFDFAAWRDAIETLGWNALRSYDEVVLANNSCYGPIFPISEMFSAMTKKPCDFWGVTGFPRAENSPRAEAAFLLDRTIPAHLQSYFLVLKANVVGSEAFAQFWRRVENGDNFLQVVARYEIQLTETLARAGFEWNCYLPESFVVQERQNHTPEFNAAYSDPMGMLILRCPFIKKKVSKYAKTEVPGLRALVGGFGYYPEELMFADDER
jgi:lipopolysaccharide biosynthesis protein